MGATGQVFIVTGVPGVGKTTVARSLAEAVGGRHVDVSELAVKEGLVTGLDERRATVILDVERLRSRLNQLMAEEKGALVLDGHAAPEAAPPAGFTLAFVLRRAPWRLKEELSARGYPEEKVRENVEAEILDVCLVDALMSLGPERVCEVDTTDRSPEETVEEMLAVIEGEKPCRHGIVDWLGHDESKELLGGQGPCMS
jgi:adenylate kinase